MKATIVRNENLELVGFQVRNNENDFTIFSWGVSPEDSNFIEEVVNKDIEIIVTQLIALKA